MSKSLVEKQFGPSAADYASCEVHASGESLARMLELTNPQKDWRVIDIATGAGHTAALFAPFVKEVIATDITAEMLEQTNKLKTQRGLDNLSTTFAQASSIPFEDQSFDLLTCRLAAHHFPDPDAFVAEAARVLKPGGTFALVDNISPDADTLPNVSLDEIRQAAHDYNNFEKLRDPSHARALSTSEWVETADRHGLALTHQEVFAKEMGFDAWVERMRCDMQTIAMLKSILDGNWNLADFLKPRLLADSIHFSLRELVLIARKAR